MAADSIFVGLRPYRSQADGAASFRVIGDILARIDSSVSNLNASHIKTLLAPKDYIALGGRCWFLLGLHRFDMMTHVIPCDSTPSY